MELALIDDDTLYQFIFKDFFDIFKIKVDIFTSGEDFIRLNPQDAMKYGFIVIDHTLCDMRGVDLVKLIKPALESEIALVSTYGNALSGPEKKGLGVSGDFQKTRLEDISNWYHYYKEIVQKKITN